jgi:hypothetical protein
MPQEELTWKFFRNGAASEKIEDAADFAHLIDRWIATPAIYQRVRDNFLKLRYEEDPTLLIDELVGLGLTRDDMMETLVDTVFTGDEDSVRMDTKTKGAVTREWKKREGDRTTVPDRTPGEDVVAEDSEEEGDFE